MFKMSSCRSNNNYFIMMLHNKQIMINKIKYACGYCVIVLLILKKNVNGVIYFYRVIKIN